MKSKSLVLATALSSSFAFGAHAEDFTIGFVSVSELNPTVASVGDGFRAEAARRGAEAIVLEVDLSNAVGSGIAAMDQLIAQGVDAIAFWPLDDQAMQAPTARAVEAGIPVFAHDLYNDPQGLVTASIIQGRSLRAVQAAQLICGAAPEGGGQILYGDFFLPAPTLTALREAFLAELANCAEPIEVATIFQNTADTVEGARPNAEAAILSNSGIFAIDNYNDATAIGASIAARSAGVRDNVLILGYNFAPDGYDALAAGRIDASWDYRGVEIGQRMARVMLEYLDGTETSPPPYTVIWPQGYTAANLDTYVPLEERLEMIAAGTDLLDAAPDTFSTGDEIMAPPALPLPVLAE